MAQQMLSIQVKNMVGVGNFLKQLPIKLQNEIMSESSTFLKDVRKSAKLRAPRYTGFLASSIFVDKLGNKQVVLTVEAPYAYEQETGEGLPRKFTKSELSQLKRSGWSREASRTRGRLIKPGGGKGMKRSYKPFLGPALESNLNKLAQKISNATNRAINKSRGGR